MASLENAYSDIFFIHLISMQDKIATFFNEIRIGNIDAVKELDISYTIYNDKNPNE
jgi:hypothetical protein